MPIRVLDKELVVRIAAGEVVERPASVVKELVENSLDAGATQIAVEARGGGVGMIRVADDGCGIPPLEVELAFERYTTSKIGRLEDLERITSLGFRGEALPSIAAVAEVEMATAAAGEAVGSFIGLNNSAIVGRRSQGRSQGTTVTVKDLFRNIPARLKFLKSPATENSHIANVVSQYALAYPGVKFSLVIDGRALLRTPGSGALLDSVAEVYGLEVARNMIEVNSAAGSSPRVGGMVGAPSVSRSSRGHLSFFVNRRWITSRLLARAVEEAYHGLLMTGRYPLAVLNISLPPDEVDVNIHPAKNEVKFQQEHVVFSAVQRAVRQALVQRAPVPEVAAAPTAPTPEPVLWDTTEIHDAPQSVQTPAKSLPVLRVLGQLAGTYIIAEGPDGLYLIDQHAAHERVLFEKIQKSLGKTEVQALLEPVTVEISPRQAEALKLHYDELAGFGFTVEPFGERTCLVRAVPALLGGRDWAGALAELLDLEAGNWREGVAASLACHSAVRAGEGLTGDELRELVRQLEQADLPNTCPHGRPTMIHLSSGKLRKEFGRAG